MDGGRDFTGSGGICACRVGRVWVMCLLDEKVTVISECVSPWMEQEGVDYRFAAAIADEDHPATTLTAIGGRRRFRPHCVTYREPLELCSACMMSTHPGAEQYNVCIQV
jgi:hypothetical protein